MKRVLITEPLADEAMAFLSQHVAVDVRLGLTPEALLSAVKDHEGLIIRSATRVTATVIEAGNALEVIGRAGIGVDNIDLRAATRQGIFVVNVPTGNTVAVAEHTIGLMLALARHIPDACAALHAGKWDKKRLTGIEIRNRVLGLVGLGKIGTAVAQRAICLEMKVIAYDPFVSPELAAREGVELVSLENLLRRADFVSIHTPLTTHTRGLIDERALALLRPTAYIINCARGGIVDEAALAEALRQERLAGAALDVFDHEPLVDSPLQGEPRAILTPHLGAATHEAQLAVSMEVAAQVWEALSGGTPRRPVNAPFLSAEELAGLGPYLDLAQRLGSFYAQMAGPNVIGLDISFGGDMAERNVALLRAALLIGMLSFASQEPINLINASEMARSRGIVVNEHKEADAGNFAELITLRARTTEGEVVVAGTVMRNEPHIVRIDDFWLDFVADGQLLVSRHVEQPGIIGRMGTLLGEANINIHFVQVGRRSRGGEGVMVLGVDDELSREQLQKLHALPSIISAHTINLCG